MKNELIELCNELESNFDEKLELYEDRLKRIDAEIGERLDHLKNKLAGDQDVAELEQLLIGLKRTHRLMQGKLSVIQNNNHELLDTLGEEIKKRLPEMRQKIEDSETYEQASIEIQKEAHSASDSFKDFFKAIMMWRDTPEEKIREKV